jgi:hypothetical protein
MFQKATRTPKISDPGTIASIVALAPSRIREESLLKLLHALIRGYDLALTTYNTKEECQISHQSHSWMPP